MELNYALTKNQQWNKNPNKRKTNNWYSLIMHSFIIKIDFFFPSGMHCPEITNAEILK